MENPEIFVFKSEKDVKKLCLFLKKIRKAKKIQTGTLAAKIGMNSSYLSTMESDNGNKGWNPTIATIMKYVNALGYEMKIMEKSPKKPK